MEKLDSYVELLYEDDMDEMVKGTYLILQLVRVSTLSTNVPRPTFIMDAAAGRIQHSRLCRERYDVGRSYEGDKPHVRACRSAALID